MPQDFIQSEPQRPSCPLFDILPAMNGRDSYRVLAGFAGISGFFPHPPYFSGGLRRGFTFGLSARRSFGREVCIPCRTERHRLPRPERRGLRSPWGQACSSANRSTDPHYWRAGPLAQSENLRSVLVIAWFVLRKTW